VRDSQASKRRATIEAIATNEILSGEFIQKTLTMDEHDVQVKV
jgi:hypothetical protein